MSLFLESAGRRWIALAVGAGTALAVVGGLWIWHGRSYLPGDASDADQVAFGARVYGRICASCHGADLDGQLGWREPMKDGTRLAPAHSDEGNSWRHSDQILFDVVKFGGAYLKRGDAPSRMPAFENRLTNDEIWSVIAFIKSSWPSDIQDARQTMSASER